MLWKKQAQAHHSPGPTSGLGPFSDLGARNQDVRFAVSGHRYIGLPILKNPTPVVRLLRHCDGAFAHRLIDRCGLRLMVNYMCALD
jgi:hypothetical protein